MGALILGFTAEMTYMNTQQYRLIDAATGVEYICGQAIVLCRCSSCRNSTIMSRSRTLYALRPPKIRALILGFSAALSDESTPIPSSFDAAACVECRCGNETAIFFGFPFRNSSIVSLSKTFYAGSCLRDLILGFTAEITYVSALNYRLFKAWACVEYRCVKETAVFCCFSFRNSTL